MCHWQKISLLLRGGSDDDGVADGDATTNHGGRGRERGNAYRRNDEPRATMTTRFACNDRFRGAELSLGVTKSSEKRGRLQDFLNFHGIFSHFLEASAKLFLRQQVFSSRSSIQGFGSATARPYYRSFSLSLSRSFSSSVTFLVCLANIWTQLIRAYGRLLCSIHIRSSTTLKAPLITADFIPLSFLFCLFDFLFRLRFAI